MHTVTFFAFSDLGKATWKTFGGLSKNIINLLLLAGITHRRLHSAPYSPDVRFTMEKMYQVGSRGNWAKCCMDGYPYGPTVASQV